MSGPCPASARGAGGTAAAEPPRGIVVASTPQEKHQGHIASAEAPAAPAPATPLPGTPQPMSSTTTPYTRPNASAATPGSLVHRIFGKDSPPSATNAGAGAAGNTGSNVGAAITAVASGTPTTAAPSAATARRSATATSAASGPSGSVGGSASLGIRTATSSSSTYNTRPPATPRDLARSTESARRRAGVAVEAPQSARARLGGSTRAIQHPVRSSVPTATTASATAAPRPSPSGPVSARGERPSSRAMSASPPAALSARDSLGSRGLGGPPPGGSRAAWGAWGAPGGGRATRVAMR